MDLQLSGRVALVVASTSGLGEATARALAAEGARVAVTGRRAERARQIAAELPDAVGIGCDLSETGAAAALVEEVTRRLGPIDVMVLNGPGPRRSTAAGLSSDDVRASVEQLLAPHVELVTLTLPRMRSAGWGRILAIGSSGVAAPIAGLALSNLARSALASYLKTLAAEVARDGVTANLLLPGRIETDRTTALDQAAASSTAESLATVQERSRATIPAARYGTPAEFGAAAAFLCGGPASYVTGVALRCDGGLVRTL